jgi:hypothetical protein
MNDSPSPGAADVAAMREIEDRVRARVRAMEEDTRRMLTQVRLLGLGFGLTLCLLGLQIFAPGLIGASASVDVVEAQRFRLLGADGVIRGEWGIDEDGSARLSLLDQRRQPRLNLTVLESGSPGMALINGDGQRRAVLGLLPDQTTTLVFADGGGIPRAVFGLTNADEANLVFADAEGVTRMGMGLAGNGLGSVLMPQDTVDTPTGPDGS